MSKYIYAHRRGTSEQWAASSVIPYAGEVVIEVDGGEMKAKIGDGIHNFAGLSYIAMDLSTIASHLDDTLTQVGKIADAGAVGTALVGKLELGNAGTIVPIIAIADTLVNLPNAYENLNKYAIVCDGQGNSNIYNAIGDNWTLIGDNNFLSNVVCQSTVSATWYNNGYADAVSVKPADILQFDDTGYEWYKLTPESTAVEIDDTLTQTGEAADAKAVGDALATKLKLGDGGTFIPIFEITNDVNDWNDHDNEYAIIKDTHSHYNLYHSGDLVTRIVEGSNVCFVSSVTATWEGVSVKPGDIISFSGHSGWTKITVESATTANYTATILSDATNWQDQLDAGYSQTIAVAGILASDTPIVDIDTSGITSTEAYESAQADWCRIYKITTAANSITAWATSATEANLLIELKVVR